MINQITDDKKAWFGQYFSDVLNMHIKRYGNKENYHIDLQNLYIYEYPIYIETPSNLINSIANVDESFDALEEEYFNFFNSDISYYKIINNQNFTEDLNLTYNDKFLNMSYISFNNHYFVLINNDGKLDLNILLSCDSTEKFKKEASKSFLNLIREISKL